MASVDLYAVLELPRTAEPDAVKAAYRRLAKLRHPDKNPSDPNATANFQKLHDAYSTLSDPLKRRQHDLQYQPPRAANTSQNGAQGAHTETPSPWTFNNRKPSQFSETNEMRKHRQRQEELENLQQTLNQQRTGIEKDLLSAKANLQERKAALGRLMAEAAKDKRDEAARSGWFGFLWRLTPEQEEERDRRATARRTGMLVIEAQIEQRISVLKQKEELLQKALDGILEVIRQKAAAKNQYDWARKAEQTRQQEEEQRRSAEARSERQRREKAAQEAEARRRSDEAARAAEAQRARQATEAQNRKQAAEEAARRFKQAYEAAKAESKAQRESDKPKWKGQGTGETEKSRQGRTPKYSERQGGSCQHRAWWDQIPGPGSCQRCQRRTPRFAFRCPGCEMIACAGCRVALRKGA
ncbi:hypothetical protein AUP68_08999 [Ilyonectria robusta]